jgi:histone H3/H4
MATTPDRGIPADVERILREAWSAFRDGVRKTRVDAEAVEAFRSYFIPKICVALEQPDWTEAWEREKPYVVAYVEAMGRHAGKVAAADRRRVVTAHDVHESRTKMRGYLPVAGRWCPQ